MKNLQYFGDKINPKLDLKFLCFTIRYGDRGSTVVKVLCYKSEGRWFDPSWCQLDFSLT